MKSPQFPVACFAPALTDAKLAGYRGLFQSAPVDAETKDALNSLLACVDAWWEAPESDAQGDKFKVKHQGQEREIRLRPLTPALIAQLDATTPWLSELDRLSNPQATGLLDRLPAGPLRDAAFHLLWHAREIANDREPLTRDVLSE